MKRTPPALSPLPSSKAASQQQPPQQPPDLGSSRDRHEARVKPAATTPESIASSNAAMSPLAEPQINNEALRKLDPGVNQDKREPFPAGSQLPTIEELRRKMEEALALKQTQSPGSPPRSRPDRQPKTTAEQIAARRRRRGQSSSSEDITSSSSPPPTGMQTASTESTKTVRGEAFTTPANVVPKTPSYPFPRMGLKLTRGQSQMSGPIHRPFTLLSPTNAPGDKEAGHQPKTVDIPASDPSTPARDRNLLPSGTMSSTDDLMYPAPNLYDITLKLNADSGLDSWWLNVVQIFQDHYGAERAILAVPGDVTDLENVPWGQKATFNVLGAEVDGPEVGHPTGSIIESAGQSSSANTKAAPASSSILGSDLKSPSSTRPAPESRHSFAGFPVHRQDEAPGTKDVTPGRPKGPLRTISNQSTGEAPAAKDFNFEAITKEDKRNPNVEIEGRTPDKHAADVSETTSQSPLVKVFPVPQALEQECDALIRRTGIVNLFGKRKPVLLTREYLDDSSASQEASPLQDSSAADDKSLVTPKGNAKGKLAAVSSQAHLSTVNNDAQRTAKKDVLGGVQQAQKALPLKRTDKLIRERIKKSPAYEEYEQPSPSPWSQSPGPSPAPRADPSQNPFFSMPASVDETAFAHDPPVYDYSQNHPFEALGVDRSKTVIHIPLIRSAPSRSAPVSTLRFPIAVISILSSMVPYPATLRKSLALLLPHLTNSYSLAQQYSNLETRLNGTANQRLGRNYLGGTFSDESSELELVAELSGQLGYSAGEGIHSTQGSIHTPSTYSAASNRSREVSATSTPALDHALYGFSPGLPSTPGRSGADIVDSYFFAKKQKPTINSSGQAKTKAPGHQPEVSDSRQPPTVSQNPPPAKSPQSIRRQRPGEAQIPNKGKFSISQRSQPSSSPTSPRKTSFLEEEESIVAEPARADTQLSQQEASAIRHASAMSANTQATRDAISRPLPDLISQLMLNSIPLQLFMAKPRTGTLVWTNTKFDAYRSQGPEERVRDPWQNVHPDEREDLAKGFRRALKTGQQMTQHARVKRFNNDSDYRWFIFRASTLLNQNGELLYWIGSFLDVHEQHLAEKKAAKEKENFAIDAKYRALAKSIPQVLFEAVENVGITSVNEQWPSFSGQSMEDAMNLGFTRHVHPEDLEKCGVLAPKTYASEFGKKISADFEPGSAPPRSPNESGSVSESSQSSNKTVQANKFQNLEALSVGTPSIHPPNLRALIQRGIISVEEDENGKVSYSTEMRLRSKGGEFRWHLVRLNKAESKKNGNGGQSWYGTCTDINDRKLLERELNNAMQRLHNEMEGKTKFFSNMSHEIRTPLNGILGIIPFLIDTKLDIDQRRMLDTIQNSSANLRELVDNILDVSKVEAGKMSLAPTWFHVRALLEEVIDTISSRAIEKRLELNYMVDLDVPPQVYGDRFRIRQILINLMGNAVKFTDQGEVFTHCSIEKRPETPVESGKITLAFDVVDTGKGISEEDVQRLFQQFSQISTNSTQQAGSGLGLFLSKQLVEMHGGKLTPISQHGEGATFRFTVKVELPSESNKPMSPTSKTMKRQFSSVSDTGLSSPRGGPEKNPLTVRGFAQSPGSTRLTSSPGQESPTFLSSSSSDPSVRSISNYRSERSSLSSMQPTPESIAQDPAAIKLVMPAPGQQATPDLAVSERSVSTTPGRKDSVNEASSDVMRQTIYSIVVICPEQHARAAIKQHIEQVVPHQIAANVTTINDVDEWVALMGGPSAPMLTHIVLDLPETHDVEDFMRQSLASTAKLVPSMIIITDHYQKRNLAETYEAMLEAGRNVYLLSKPVKPSIFSFIFDPTSQRDLSKDRNRDLAQNQSDSFKSVAKMVKDAVGNKGYRVLVVEDNATNRGIIVKYLNLVKLDHETANDGLECTNMVFARDPGYYSLIICDIEMPVKNGYETCRDVRAWEAQRGCPPHPIMALSANAMTEQMEMAAQAGFTDYVTKPVVYNEFGKIIMNLLDPRVPHTYLKDRAKKIS